MQRTKVPKNQRHIVAMGGGASAPEVLAYVLKLSGKTKPKVLVINTATGDKPAHLKLTGDRFTALGATVTNLLLFDRTPVDLEGLLCQQDVIFVGGGNTKSMLAVWREYGLDDLLRTAWKRGVIMSGSSAGGICWFENCVTDSWDESYTALPALGFLKGSCCPHYDGEKGRRAAYHSLMLSGHVESEGYAIDEGVGLHFVGKKLLRVVTAKQSSGARHVVCRKGQVGERILLTEIVGKK